MNVRIDNEWGRLKHVLVGHGLDMGEPPSLDSAYDPTTIHHLRQGDYPQPDAVAAELDQLSEVLEHEGVDVLRPHNLIETEQVFARDVGFVMENRFYRSAMIAERQDEWAGIAPHLAGLAVNALPEEVQLEGGDVLALQGAIAVGVTLDPQLSRLKTARTNAAGVDFLASEFPHLDILPIELHKHDTDPLRSALHLDCAFMPLGGGEAIACREAFLREEQWDALTSRFDDIIHIDLTQSALLQSNLLHLDAQTLLIDPRFTGLAGQLHDRGYRLVEVSMANVGKMGGLFRCSTLPLIRN